MKDFLSRFRQPGSRSLAILAVIVAVALALNAGIALLRTTTLPALTDPGSPLQDAPVVQPVPGSSAGVGSSAPPGRVVERLMERVLPLPAGAGAGAVPKRLTAERAALLDTPLSVRLESQYDEALDALPTASPGYTPCQAGSGQVVTETVSSAVLDMAIPVDVYLPPCYNPDRYTYPVLYLIRGTDGYGNWVRNGLPEAADALIHARALPPFIAIMPGTDEWAHDGGKYRYSTSGPNSWEGFMLDELMPLIESRYSTWGNRDGRAIGGISRGAYWSLEIAFRHPDLFSAVGAHSPAITPDILIGVPADFSMLSLSDSADAARSLRIFLDAGDHDWAARGVKRLVADLDQAGVPYISEIGEGTHDDAYWASRMSDYLAFYTAEWPRVARARPEAGTAGSAPMGQP